jgi:hypothetical protein
MPLDPKQTLLGKIEGLKISNEAFSNVSFFNSFPSLNSANSLTFLTDFFKLFFGGERIKNDLVRFLATELKSLGEDLLRYYKKHIVEYYYCNIDTVIPDEFFQEISFKIKEIDFFGILKINPDSELGAHYYQDYPDNLDKLLYIAVQNEGTEYNWLSIIIVRYENQRIYVKLDPSLQGKTVYEFVTKYLSNIKLFDDINIISDIIDAIFGTLSSIVNISKQNLYNKIQFEILFDRVMESLDVDDSFYSFDTEALEEIAKKRIEGYYEFVDCEVNYVKYDYNLLQDFIKDIKEISHYNEEVYNVNFDYLVNQTSKTVSPSDKQSYSNNIFLDFFRYLGKSIVMSLFSPKKVLFVRMFAKMAAKIDLDPTFAGFFKEHKNFILDIIKKHVMQAILKYLLTILIQELSKMIIENNIKKQQEQLKYYLLQITSLVGL